MEMLYRDSLPDDVRSAFDKAVEALPQEHRRAPITGDEGFALVTASKVRDRLRVNCLHHGRGTRNKRSWDCSSGLPRIVY
ncbi:hypothetical protein HRG_014903 [Hirsutella rhossiliensis]